jgi:hypothetical protein
MIQRKHRHNDFVNRTTEFDQLIALVQGEIDTPIALLKASDGMGKTWLLEELRKTCGANEIPTLWIDFSIMEADASYWSVSNLIERQLGPPFVPALFAAHKEIEKNRRWPEQVANEIASRQDISKSAATATIEGAIDATNVVVGYQINFNHPQKDQEWERTKLTDALNLDLTAFTAEKRLVVLIDDWDSANQEMRLWVRTSLLDWIDNNYADHPICAVIAGEYLDDILYERISINLTPLSESDVHEYWVEKRRLPSEIPPQLMSLLRGKPLHMSVIASALGARAKSGQAVGFAEAFVAILDDRLCIEPEIASIIRSAAVPVAFNQMILDDFVGYKIPFAKVKEYLKGWDLLQSSEAGGMVFHKDIRQNLLDWWREIKPDDYLDLNRKALLYYEKQPSGRDDKSYTEHLANVIYHAFVINEYEEGLPRLIEHFEDAFSRYQRPEAAALLKPVSEIKGLQPLTQAWLRYFQLRLDITFQGEDFDPQPLYDLQAMPRDDLFALDDVLRVCSSWTLGEIAVQKQQWEAAIRLFEECEGILKSNVNQAMFYDARIFMSLGSTYRNLAEVLGGFPSDWQHETMSIAQLLGRVQNVPYALYRYFVRRWSIFPNWHFDPNYQAWLIASLLIKARKCYEKAENRLRTGAVSSLLEETRMYLADIEHRLGLWAWARKHYQVLHDSAGALNQTIYRRSLLTLQAQRAYLAEGDLDSIATQDLMTVANYFNSVHDWHSAARAFAVLGAVKADFDNHQDMKAAIRYYENSITTFGLAADWVRRTQIAHTLEQLSCQPNFPEAMQPDIQNIVNSVQEWHYIARFPHRLLYQFRRWALLGALPLTYMLLLVGGLMVIGRTLGTAGSGFYGFSLLDTLALVGGALTPLVALWLYPIIYSIVGFLIVLQLTHKLKQIAQEQPAVLHLDSHGIHYSNQDESLLRWDEIRDWVTMDCYLIGKRPISLVSRTIVATDQHTCEINGTTAGYAHAQQKMRELFSRANGGKEAQLQHRDFKAWKSFVVALVIALVITFALWPSLRSNFSVKDFTTGTTISLPLVGFLLPWVLIYWLTLPFVLLSHYSRYVTTRKRALPHIRVANLISSRSLWLITFIITLLMFVIFIMLLLSGVSVETE